MFLFKLEKPIIFICDTSQTQPSGVLAKYHDLEWQSF